MLLGCLYAAVGGCITNRGKTTESKHTFQPLAQTPEFCPQGGSNQRNRRFGGLNVWFCSIFNRKKRHFNAIGSNMLFQFLHKKNVQMDLSVVVSLPSEKQQTCVTDSSLPHKSSCQLNSEQVSSRAGWSRAPQLGFPLQQLAAHCGWAR